MKLIIAGASGFVASELLRQSLRRPEITSVIALARKPVSAPENLGPEADASKLKSLVLEDYGHYTEDVKKEFAGADACIWYAAPWLIYLVPLISVIRHLGTFAVHL